MKLEIEKLDHFGRGVAHIDGKVCFVEGALPGEIVEVEIIKENKKYLVARAIDCIQKSLDRVVEKCSYFNRCGGCCFEHYDYEKENIYKEEKVKELVNRFSKINTTIKGIEYSSCKNYRNKVVLHSKNGVLGYYEKNSNDLVEIDSCNLLDKRINDLIGNLKELVKNNIGIKEILIRTDNDSTKVMVKITGEVSNVSFLDDVDVLVINDKVMTNNEKIISYIGDKKYYLSVDSFFQINKSLTKKLYDEVLDVAIGLRPNKVLDLYCGTGTIGIYVAQYCKKVISVDYSLSNINDAIDNMRLNNINNIEFINDKVENVIDKFDNIDLVIVDPPRAGLDKKTIDNLIRIGSDAIVYVSCDPLTLVRDLDLLSDMYDVMYIKPFNMFPRTYHCEAIAVLERK